MKLKSLLKSFEWETMKLSSWGTHNVLEQELALIFNEIFGKDKHSVGIIGMNISVNFNAISSWMIPCVCYQTVHIYGQNVNGIIYVTVSVLDELF